MAGGLGDQPAFIGVAAIECDICGEHIGVRAGGVAAHGIGGLRDGERFSRIARGKGHNQRFKAVRLQHGERKIADAVVQFRTVGVDQLVVQEHAEGAVCCADAQGRAVEFLGQPAGKIERLPRIVQPIIGAVASGRQLLHRPLRTGVHCPALVALPRLAVLPDDRKIIGGVLHGGDIGEQHGGKGGQDN